MDKLQRAVVSGKTRCNSCQVGPYIQNTILICESKELHSQSGDCQTFEQNKVPCAESQLLMSTRTVSLYLLSCTGENGAEEPKAP